MGRFKGESLTHQIRQRFDSMLKIGESKTEDKILGISDKYIYSWDTYHSYIKHACYFAEWAKKQPVLPEIGHKPRTLEELRPYAEKWLQSNIDAKQSAYTIKLETAALAKLYGCKMKDFNVDTPKRNRGDIKRSRGEAARDKGFSEERNKDLVTFCHCTGLRRAELKQIRGADLREVNGKYYLEITRGTKGGRSRTSPIMGSDEELKIVLKLLKDAGNDKVFPTVNSHADIHGYRAQYATRVYEANKRPMEVFENERLLVHNNRVFASYTSKNCHVVDRETYKDYYTGRINKKGYPEMKKGYRDVSSMYHCKRDLAGTVYDRMALFAASNALGHNRESVVAEHYIRA